jgi:hypothetical protein
MRSSIMKLSAAACLTLGHIAIASVNAAGKPQIQTLPPLREQAKIVDAWTEERKSLIPGILQKYNVDAWIVCPNLPIVPQLFPSSPYFSMLSLALRQDLGITRHTSLTWEGVDKSA